MMTAKPRIGWLDGARAFAIVCVVLNHAVEATYALNVKTLLSEPPLTRLFAHAMFTCGRLGVPIFFFLSGYLLLDVEYDIRGGGYKFFRRNFCGLLLTTWIWIVFYNIFNGWLNSPSFKCDALVRNLLFLQGTAMSHMWYMPAILGIYLFIPMVAGGLRQVSLKFLKIPLTLAFLYMFVRPEYNVVAKAIKFYECRGSLDFSFAGGSYGFLLIVGYLVKKTFFNRLNRAGCSLLAIAGYSATVYVQYLSYGCGITYNVWYNNATLFIASLAIFLFFSQTHFSSRLLESISRCSFGIFLLHNVFIKLLRRYLPAKPRTLRLAVLFLVAFLVSWLLVALLSRSKKCARIMFFVK